MTSCTFSPVAGPARLPLPALRSGLPARLQIHPHQPRYGITRTHAALQALRQLDQQQIAGVVAIQVVEHFEIIQIQEQHRAVMSVACRGCERLPHAVLQKAAIGSSVSGRSKQAVNLSLGLAILGNVGMDANVMSDAPSGELTAEMVSHSA